MPPAAVTPSHLRLSLIPWAAFLVTVLIADSVAHEPATLFSVLAAAPLYLPFVALPALLPLAIARHRATTLIALTAMTGTSIYTAAAMVASDDAQAGLTVFFVPYVAVPLAALLWAGEAVTRRLGR